MTTKEFEAQVAAIRRQERKELAKEIYIRLIASLNGNSEGFNAAYAFSAAQTFLDERDKL